MRRNGSAEHGIGVWGQTNAVPYARISHTRRITHYAIGYVRSLLMNSAHTNTIRKKSICATLARWRGRSRRMPLGGVAVALDGADNNNGVSEACTHSCPGRYIKNPVRRWNRTKNKTKKGLQCGEKKAKKMVGEAMDLAQIPHRMQYGLQTPVRIAKGRYINKQKINVKKRWEKNCLEELKYIKNEA